MSRDRQVVQLPSAGVPADQGLASLGLIMQLGGTVAGLGVSLAAFSMLLGIRDSRGDALWMFLLLGTCVVRSLFHRFAGTELLYGTRAQPLNGVRVYIALGLVHSVVLGVAMKVKFGAATDASIGLALGLAVWPAILGGMFLVGTFARFGQRIPVAEDKGFEGAAILMTVLGLCGALVLGIILLAIFGSGARALREGRVVLLMLALVMLLVRSMLHVRAGLSGLRTTSIDRAVEHANRYASFGIVSAFCAGGAMLLGVMTTKLDVTMLAVVSGMTWMLMAWPMLVRRFFGDRQFADLIAGDNADVHRRAPDAGLTCLGWLLIAHAAYGLSFQLPGLVADDLGVGRVFDTFDAGIRSPWWNIGIAMFELWAGFELIRMTVHHRIIATAYAVVTAVLTLYLCWPQLEGVKHLKLADTGRLISLMPVVIALVIPVATLVLVNRKVAPTATARFKK